MMMNEASSPYSWTQDPLFEHDLAAEIAAHWGHRPPQVPSAHGPEPKDLPSDHYQTTVEARCELEYVDYNIHRQPTVRSCRYPWYHEGAHGYEIPELYREWDALATTIERLQEAQGER